MSGLNVKNTMIEGFLHKVAPHPCFGCAKIGTPLCDNCKYDIISEPFTGCFLCSEPISGGICLKHDTSISRVWVVGERRNTLHKLVDAYKFQYMKSAGLQLAQLLDEHLPSLPASTCIVPIPTARAHIRARGFDHIDVIARHFATLRNLSIHRVLSRTSSVTQHELNRANRLTEANNAFVLNADTTIDPADTYLILDDVITTGATVTAAARVLESAGAKTIIVGALAYQPLD